MPVTVRPSVGLNRSAIEEVERTSAAILSTQPGEDLEAITSVKAPIVRLCGFLSIKASMASLEDCSLRGVSFAFNSRTMSLILGPSLLGGVCGGEGVRAVCDDENGRSDGPCRATSRVLRYRQAVVEDERMGYCDD